MTHKDGRVVMSAWVEPALRDYAREAARVADVQFSRCIEGAVQRAVAEQSAAKALRIYPVHASNLTDVVTALEDERDKLRSRLVETQAEVERLREALEETEHAMHLYDKAIADSWRKKVEEVEDQRNANAREIDKLRAERRQLRARLVECRPWVGVCPFPNTARFSEMLAIRDLADDTLEEVKP